MLTLLLRIKASAENLSLWDFERKRKRTLKQSEIFIDDAKMHNLNSEFDQLRQTLEQASKIVTVNDTKTDLKNKRKTL